MNKLTQAGKSSFQMLHSNGREAIFFRTVMFVTLSDGHIFWMLYDGDVLGLYGPVPEVQLELLVRLGV